jgi:2-polyprenyl-3-methyl-5-hydroxy-6-metoxy-1,4-benzoquinol methylase
MSGEASQPGPGMWERFFDSHAERYEENGFTKHTVSEIDFLLNLYAVPRDAHILDVGCGTGRHSIELARRGFRVTGIDLSEGMLSVARRNAESAGVEVEFLRRNAKDFSFDEPFDLAICLCEGGVGLIERGEDAEAHDRAIFRNIANSLKPNAPFLLTALNGYAVIRQMSDERIHEGRFDPARMISHYEDDWTLPEGPRRIKIYERLFIAPEVTKMLQESGFHVDNVFGGTAGHWGQRFLSLDEVEAMFVCRKRS